jgi:hypothetical protein
MLPARLDMALSFNAVDGAPGNRLSGAAIRSDWRLADGFMRPQIDTTR